MVNAVMTHFVHTPSTPAPTTQIALDHNVRSMGGREYSRVCQLTASPIIFQLNLSNVPCLPSLYATGNFVELIKRLTRCYCREYLRRNLLWLIHPQGKCVESVSVPEGNPRVGTGTLFETRLLSGNFSRLSKHHKGTCWERRSSLNSASDN